MRGPGLLAAGRELPTGGGLVPRLLYKTSGSKRDDARVRPGSLIVLSLCDLYDFNVGVVRSATMRDT